MENPFAALQMPNIGQDITNGFLQGRAIARQDAEDHRKLEAREAAGTILGGVAPMNALARFSAPPAAPQKEQPNPAVADAWRTLARSDPELFTQLRGFDNDQRKAAGEALKAHLDLTGRAMGSLLDVAPEQRAAVYASEVKPWLEQQGVTELPEVWDENVARAHLRMAATAAQALGVDVSRDRLAWDIEDDKADNLRADRNADSLNAYREGQLDNTRRGQDLTDARGRRGQDMSSRDRRRGQDVTDRRARDLHGRRVRGKPVTSSEGIIQMPDGRTGVVRNGKWVDAATGKAL